MRRLIILIITVNSANLVAIKPYGFRALDVDIALEVDNPAMQLKLSNMQAVVKRSGKVIGTVTVAPFTLKARSVKTYDLTARMALDESVSLLSLMMSLDDKFIDDCVIDVTVKGQIRGGLSKTITLNDIPLKKLINYA